MRWGWIVSGALTLAVGGWLYTHVYGIPASVTELVARVIPAAAPAPPALPRAPVPVAVTTLRVEEVPIYLTGIGTVQAYNTVAVKSRVDGQITQILFTEGQDVKAGDPLAIIDPRSFEAQLQQQEAIRQKDQALLQSASLDLQRSESLVSREFASRQIVDQQRATVAQLKAQILNDEAQIQFAKTQLSYTRINAPISGRVGIRQIDAGNFVRAMDPNPIAVITQLQPISVIFTLSATSVAQAKLSLGSVKVPVVALGVDDTTVLDRGTIDLIDNQVDQATGTIKLKASFPNEGLKLWPGNFLNGRLTVDTRKEALTLPSAAVRHGPRGDFAWVVKPDMTVEPRTVTVGQAFGGRTLIERGLARNDRVVIEGWFRLENGAKVEITRTVPSTPGPGTPGQGQPPAQRS